MTAKQIIESAAKETFKEASQNPYHLSLEPGLSLVQIEHVQRRLAAPLPNEIRELLALTSGFDFKSFGRVDFSAREPFGLKQVLPLGATLAIDPFGNHWAVDIGKDTGDWGPVLFVAHDPPVTVIQAPNLATFVEQVFDSGRTGRKNQLELVTKKAVRHIWRVDPYLSDLRSSRRSSDPVIAEFSRQLPDTFQLVDLRPLEIGSGFAWGRNGPNTVIKRCGSQLVFGVERRMPFF